VEYSAAREGAGITGESVGVLNQGRGGHHRRDQDTTEGSGWFDFRYGLMNRASVPIELEWQPHDKASHYKVVPFPTSDPWPERLGET
jgi:hypothetical protein